MVGLIFIIHTKGGKLKIFLPDYFYVFFPDLIISLENNAVT